MVSMNLGSIATRVLNRVDGISTTISGALIDIADEQRLFMEEYTGLTIGSVGIAEKYQPALIDLTTAKTLDMMQLEGGDFSSLSLGDFSVEKGTDSNLNTAGTIVRKDAMEKLKRLGSTIRFRRVIG